MTYYCDIRKQGEWYVPHFPDMMNVLTCAETHESALSMAQEALNAVLKVDVEKGYPIPAPLYTDGYPVEVFPDIATAIMQRMSVSASVKDAMQPRMTKWRKGQSCLTPMEKV